MRRAVRTVLVAVALLGGLPLTAAGAATPAPFDTPQPGLRAAPSGSACAGAIEIRVGAGAPTCTHGPDPAPAGIDVSRTRPPLPVSTPRGTTARTEATAPLCTGDGTTGPRVQLVYARPIGAPDRYEAYAASFQAWAAQMEAGLEESAAQTGGIRRFRFVHDASCTPTITRVVVPSAAITEWGTFVNAINALHGDRSDRRYMVWMDATEYCGVAQFYGDDRPDGLNLIGGSLVARVDSGCWGIPGELAEGHELMHTLGGVQPSAPHSTGSSHCTDEIDRMCGNDGSGKPLTLACPGGHENLFDCNHDDYFHTDPPPGNYLDTHWNTANSRFLAGPASAPTDVRAVAGEASAEVTWAPPAEGAAAVTGYRLTTVVDGVARPPTTLPASPTTHVATGLPDGARVTFAVAAIDGNGVGLKSQPSTPVVASDGTRFHPLPPARILDTRTGNGAPAMALVPGGAVHPQVTGRGGVPESGVSAVVLNVTVTEPWSGGYLTVWPRDEPQPLASNLNFGANQTVANLVTVKLGAGGQISISNQAGVTHVIADVAGWYGPSGALDGSRYHALAPARLLDTRAGNGAPVGKVGASIRADLQVAGRGGVPAAGATAVVLNLTVTEPTGVGFAIVWPAGDLRPLASNLNFVAGQTVANLVTVKLGAGGMVSLYGDRSALHLVADVAGWFGADGETTGARYHPVNPARVLDTRVANGAPAAAVPPAGSLDLSLLGRSGIPTIGVSTVVLNVTVVDPLGLGFLTTWPTGDARPLASVLNFVPGRTVPNLVVAKLGTAGKVSLYNGGSGAAHLVADVAGWYGPG